MAEQGPTGQGPTGQGPTEEELLAALDKIGVRDVLVQALATSVSIGFRRVSAEARDLPQVRLAIESLRALEPVPRENGVDEALVRDLEQARANLQLAYATAVAEEGASRSTEGQPAEAAASAEGGASSAAVEGDESDRSTGEGARQAAGEGAPPNAREERAHSDVAGDRASGVDGVDDAAGEGREEAAADD